MYVVLHSYVMLCTTSHHLRTPLHIIFGMSMGFFVNWAPCIICGLGRIADGTSQPLAT